MDIREYPATVKLHPELRQMKSDEARTFVFNELVAAMQEYTRPKRN